MTDERNGAQSSGIEVVGRGRAAGAPDHATVTLGVSVRSATAPAAISEASAAAEAVLTALADLGIAYGDVHTTRYGIHQEWRHEPTGAVADGFRVQNTVVATVRDPDAVGAVIDAAAAAAGEWIEVQGVDFALIDPSILTEAARSAAFAEARRAAEQLAELAGRRLGAVEWIREGDIGGPAPAPRVMMARAESTTPILAGDSTVEVLLTVRFALVD